MVDGWFLLDAMGGIHEEQLMLTKDFLNLADYTHQTRRSPRKVWVTALIAAILALLLAACGYAVYRATMAHRELHPEDEKVYFFDGDEGTPNEGLHMDLNFGTCAMALHFDTEETGHVYGFRMTEGAPVDLAWSCGGTTLKELFVTYLPGGDRPEEQQRPLEQCLRDAGMTEAESEEWYYSLTFSSDTGLLRPAMQIEVLDGAKLHGLDLILGWPEGKSTVIKEETQGDVQILETLIEVPMKNGETERNLFLFRFDTKRQVLLSIAGADEVLDFPTLEAIAEHIELRETGFVYSLDHSGQNWSIFGLAFG
jgi:hypothetical protein